MKENTNKCRYCGKEILGITSCNCKEKLGNEKLWDRSMRKKERKLKKVVTI